MGSPPGMNDPPVSNGECFGFDVTCANGELTGHYDYGCLAYTGRCELGCRKDNPSRQTSYGGDNHYESLVESGRRLCEEYRLEHGARRPDDACDTDFDCLPFPPNMPRDGTAWPAPMSCVGGNCREQAPEAPSDFGAPCTPIGPLGTADAVTSYGIVVEGTCENAVCNIIDQAENDPGRCTMQCVDDSGCPSGWICGSVSIGRIFDLYKIAAVRVCLDPCTWNECNAGAPDASALDAGTPDAGTPDAGRPDASAASLQGS